MDNIKISIIIPVYNVESYIAKCISSIMTQDLQDGIECIIVDDCSTDNSILIAEKLIDDYNGNIKFRIIKHPKNEGSSCARNTGIIAASGEYIGFVDSDDYIEPSMYEDLLNLLEESQELPFVSSSFYVERKGVTSYNRNHDLYLKNSSMAIDEFFPLFLTERIDNFCWNKLYRRTFISTLFIEHRGEEDWLFHYHNCKPLLKQNKTIGLCSKPLYHYRIREGSLSNQSTTSINPFFLDQLVNRREIMSEQKKMGNETLCNDLYNRYVSILCHGFYQVLLNKRLWKYRREDVDFFWADIKKVPFSKIPIDAYVIKKDLLFIKCIPFGRQILSAIRPVLSNCFKK